MTRCASRELERGFQYHVYGHDKVIWTPNTRVGLLQTDHSWANVVKPVISCVHIPIDLSTWKTQAGEPWLWHGHGLGGGGVDLIPGTQNVKTNTINSRNSRYVCVPARSGLGSSSRRARAFDRSVSRSTRRPRSATDTSPRRPERRAPRCHGRRAHRHPSYRRLGGSARVPSSVRRKTADTS